MTVDSFCRDCSTERGVEEWREKIHHHRLWTQQQCKHQNKESGARFGRWNNNHPQTEGHQHVRSRTSDEKLQSPAGIPCHEEPVCWGGETRTHTDRHRDTFNKRRDTRPQRRDRQIHRNKHTHTHTHTYTHTHTDKCTQTQSHRHTDTYIHTRTSTGTEADT